MFANKIECPELLLKLINNAYEFQDGNPVWLPEIGLGIGIEQGTYVGIGREWMYWYNQQEQRFLTPEEKEKLAQQKAQQAEQKAQQAQQETQLLRERLRSLGVDPDSLT